MGNSINNIKYLGRKFFGIRNLNTAPTYDTDAQAYFNVNTAITLIADKNAINQYLFVNAKSQGYYSKIKQMILPLWSTATNNKWNLVNPLDTNGAFRLTFATGVTHTTNGYVSNGTTGYANTYLPTNQLTSTSMHYGFYSQTNLTNTGVDMGVLQQTGSTSYNDLTANYLNNGAFFRSQENSGVTYLANANTTGLYIGSRTGASIKKLFKNGSLVQTLTTPANATTTTNTFLMCQNLLGTPSNYSVRKQCFSTIGLGLTDTEATNYSNNVNALMTYFGINTY